MKVDIKFIAKKAGVSTATVSRVLNKSKPVSQALEQRVLNTVIKYKYYPNTFARVLVNKRSFMICILIEDNINQFQAMLLPVITEFLSHRGYQAVINLVGKADQDKINVFEELEAKQIDGVIALFYIPPALSKRIYSKVDLPFIQSEPIIKNVSYYDINCEAAYKATQHLIKLGHRKVGGFFSNAPQGHYLFARYEGFLKALNEAEIPNHRKWFFFNGPTIENSYSLVNQLLSLDELPTALFCVSDELAIGSLIHLGQRGVKVPDDLSLMGYDGLPLGKQIHPQLSTVNQPYIFWIDKMVDELIGQIEGINPKEGEINVKEIDYPYLFEGGTCKAIDFSK